jgi:hypothetical protein
MLIFERSKGNELFYPGPRPEHPRSSEQFPELRSRGGRILAGRHEARILGFVEFLNARKSSFFTEQCGHNSLPCPLGLRHPAGGRAC